ncbi:transglutaminase family protein [Solibacillus silvestris]
MNFILESEVLDDYLQELTEVNFSDSAIQTLINKFFCSKQTEIEKVHTAFNFVRDEIAHSWDIQSEVVTCTASEVLRQKQGICYAKSNLFAALLRSQEIPTGFCYQRLMLFDTPEKGYSLHALNAVFIRQLNKWIRLDARGNKKGVNAEFSMFEEKLAFTVNPHFDEVDYPMIYVKPNSKTIDILKQSDDALVMYLNDLPEKI